MDALLVILCTSQGLFMPRQIGKRNSPAGGLLRLLPHVLANSPRKPRYIANLHFPDLPYESLNRLIRQILGRDAGVPLEKPDQFSPKMLIFFPGPVPVRVEEAKQSFQRTRFRIVH
jgi:hypothetical protein